MKSKKVLFCLYYYFPYISGISILTKNLAEQLVRDGYEVTIYCARHNANLPSQEYVNGVLIIRENVLFSLGKGVIMPLYWIKAALHARHYDAVNFQFPNADLGLSALFIERNKLSISYQCDVNLGNSFVQKYIEKASFFLMNLGLRHAGTLIATSRDYFIHSRFARYQDKLVPIYPGVNFGYLGEGTASIQIDTGKYANFYKVGFLGRIVYEKGIEYLIDALEYLEDIPVCIYIAGNHLDVRGGSIYESLKPRLKKYGERVVFLGRVEDGVLKDFYTTIDLFVLPSIDPLEAFGLVQLESLYFSTPILATDMPGIREVVRKTQYGKLIRPKDPKDIAQKIRSMYRDREKYREKKRDQVGKKLIDQYFSFEQSVEMHKKIFHLPT